MTTYARIGPPFNFLGHMNESQRDSMLAWMEARKGNFEGGITQYYQIRAQQLRKSAGLLEYYYANYTDKTLDKPAPTFKKAVWEVGPSGHSLYTVGVDQSPAVVVSRMKEVYKEQLKPTEEAVFWMNWLRNTIEKQEDKAQKAAEAVSTVSINKGKLIAYFNDPAYSNNTLVRKSDEADFRVHQLDQPTAWELKQLSHNLTT